MTSRRWTAPRPINAYVIEHRDGLVLFGTGQDRASVTDPGYFPGGATSGVLRANDDSFSLVIEVVALPRPVVLLAGLTASMVTTSTVASRK